MQVNPYLIFDGNGKEAMTFYSSLLSGQLTMMTHGESPMADQVPPAAKNLVMHAAIDLGGSIIMGADAFPPGTGVPRQGFTVTINADSVDDAERVFKGLSQGGNVSIPMEETFFADRYGEVTDRFGTPWAVVKSKPMG
jgi:PhnB protein